MRIRRLLDLWHVAMQDQGLSVGSWKTARLVWFLLWNLPFVPRRVWFSRMLTCRRCAVYRPKTRQCGSPPYGCGCSMPLKALLRGSECWARERGEDFGWKT